MAETRDLNEQFLELLRDGKLEKANLLRRANPEFKPDLCGADLRDGEDERSAFLSGVNLSGADLSGAEIRGRGMLLGAYFEDADLSGANLRGVDLYRAKFRDANLKGVKGLSETQNLGWCHLAGARNVSEENWQAYLAALKATLRTD